MSRRIAVWLLSVAVGTFYGLSLRLAFGQRLWAPQAGLWIMTVSFLAVVPFAMGFLTVSVYGRALSKRGRKISKGRSVSLPIESVMLTLVVTVLFKVEGLICMVFIAPIALIFGILGGLAAGFIQRGKDDMKATTTLSVALAPLLLLAIELHIPQRFETRTVETSILIHASPQAIWSNIEKVDAIQPDELPSSWARRIGFPRPIAATLSHEGIGGVRHASFAGGLIFTETIDHWDAPHDLSFSIKANTDSIPPTTLDEHVTIGGPYFDVLEGEYSLEPLDDGAIRLHLRSRERLSTHFNAYAGLWTDAVMRDIQNSILQVIKQRCERTATVTY